MGRRRGVAQVCALIVVIALTGCGILLGGDTGRGGGDVEVPSPEQALDAAGLELPDGVTDAALESKDLEGRRSAYAITFTASRADAEAFCDQLGGLGHLSAISPTDQPVLGEVSVTPETRGCNASTAKDGIRWFRFAMVDGGDPTTVRVALQDIPR